MRRRSLLQGCAGGLLLGGCGAPPPPRPPPREVPRLHLDPLSDLVPAGGLDTLVQVRWGQVLRALDTQLQPLLSPAGLDALGEYLGFELRLIEELVVATFGPTTLYLLRAPHDPEKVERLFRGRLSGEQKRSNDGPGVARVTGRIGVTPRGLATLLPDVLAYEVGPTGPLRAVVAFAQEKLKKARPALVAEPLAEVAERLGDAPIRAFFPTPAASWQGAHGLLPRASGGAFALSLQGTDLALRAVLLGEWGDPPEEALRRLELTRKDLTGSALGHLLGLEEPVEAYRQEGDARLLSLSAVLSTERLVRGLRDITRASLDELFPGIKRTPLRRRELPAPPRGIGKNTGAGGRIVVRAPLSGLVEGRDLPDKLNITATRRR